MEGWYILSGSGAVVVIVVVLGKCASGATKYCKQSQHLFHVNLILSFCEPVLI
jgi:hypothetical protein